MIHKFVRAVVFSIKLTLLTLCAMSAIFGGIIVIAAPDMLPWDRFMALVATIFFGFCCIVIIKLETSK